MSFHSFVVKLEIAATLGCGALPKCDTFFFYILEQSFFTRGNSPSKDIRWCLEMFWVVTTWGWWVLLAPGGYRPGIVLHTR